VVGFGEVRAYSFFKVLGFAYINQLTLCIKKAVNPWALGKFT
jgi:hypothetical protein